MTAINTLKEGEKLMTAGGKWIATKTKERVISKILLADKTPIVLEEFCFVLNHLQLLSRHSKFIERDFKWVASQRKS